MTLGALLLPLVLSAVSVRGPAECPSAAVVERRLGELAPSVGQAFAVVIDRRDAQVVVELTDEAGAVQVKELPAVASCAELEEATAVFVAAWVRSLEAAPPPLELQVPPPPPPANAWELGLSVVAGWSEHPVGGGLELGWWSGRWGLGLRLVYPGSGTVRLGGGEVWWARPAARLGPRVRFEPGPVEIDLRVELVAAALAMEGHGFPANESAWSFDPGLGATARIGLRAGRFLPWLAVGGTGWFKDHALTVAGVDAAARLPRGEAFAALGVSLILR
ncbi:MAG: hypothetical protein QM765_34065 [Myxococcales bacterium]